MGHNKRQLSWGVYPRSLVVEVALPLEFERESWRHVDWAVKLEAEGIVGVAAGELCIGGTARRRTRTVRRAAIAFRFCRPSREHCRVDGHWLFLHQEHIFINVFTSSVFVESAKAPFRNKFHFVNLKYVFISLIWNKIKF